MSAVIADHAGFPLEGGHLGVDIFFVISGFLLTRIIMAELSDGRFSLLRFYERRARRILPALFFVVLACIPAAWVLMSPEELEAFGRSLIALVFFATNFLFWSEVDYFAPAATELPLIHTWSLAVEEQFYILYPVLLIYLWKSGSRNRQAFGIGVLLSCSLLASYALVAIFPESVFYLLPYRAWELLAGSLIAILLVSRGADERPGRSDQGLSALGLILILMSLTHAWPASFPKGSENIAVVAGTVLIIASGVSGTFVHWILSARLAVAIGLVSYSAYLWHQPIFAFARLATLELPGPRAMLGLILLTFALSWVSWHFIEQPARKRLPLSAVVKASFLAGSTAVVFGLAVWSGDGLAMNRLSEEKRELLQSTQVSPLREECTGWPLQLPPPGEACVYFSDTPPTWAVLGDSHGVELAYALAGKLEERGESLVHLTANGCPPAYSFDARLVGCSEWTRQTVDWIAANNTIGTVVLVYRYASHLAGKNENDFPRLPPVEPRMLGHDPHQEQVARYWRSFEAMANRLEASGKRVILVEPIPEIGRHIDRYIMLSNNENERLETVNFDYYLARNETVRLFFKQTNFEILGTASRLCDEAVCYGSEGGLALYSDGDHLSIRGAAKLVDAFFEQQAMGAK
ncbi:MAG: acyltransferase [Rhodobacteraceae bacterium]|nr:acyltransferase [Paracoccaceae bacterium]